MNKTSFFLFAFLIATAVHANCQTRSKSLFVDVTASKKEVYEQEPVKLTYKVYSLVDLLQIEGHLPELDGWHSKEVAQPAEVEPEVKEVGGRKYNCMTWDEYIMYPQVSGRLTIPRVKFNFVVLKQKKADNPFDAFFGDESSTEEVKTSEFAPSIDIVVRPLPDRPVGFSGGVGEFSIFASLLDKSPKAGELLTVRVIVRGSGNLKLIRAPEVHFPKDFTVFDVVTTDSTEFTDEGYRGKMIFDYRAEPANQGVYSVPPVTFVYFDPVNEKFVTLTTDSISLHVARGNAFYSSQLDKDIHTIKKGQSTLQARRNHFFGSLPHILIIVSLILIYAVVALLARLRGKRRGTDPIVRKRNAFKTALRSLRKARKMIGSASHDEFYGILHAALLGYLSDKIGVTPGEVSTKKIQGQLSEMGVDTEASGRLLMLVDKFEAELFSPTANTEGMETSYGEAKDAMEKMEKELKRCKQRKKAIGTSAVMLLLCLLFPLHSYSVSKQDADWEYIEWNFQKSIRDYNALLRDSVSADVYYNLGNSYYHVKDYGQAIAAYERARLLAPADSDIDYNLKKAYGETVDKDSPHYDTFYVVWIKSFINRLSIDEWAVVGIAFLVASLLLLLLRTVASKLLVRRVVLVVSCCMIAVFILSNVFALYEENLIGQSGVAIVVAEKAPVKQYPFDKSKDLVTLHEGARLVILDRGMHGWMKVANGKWEGWMQTDYFKEI